LIADRRAKSVLYGFVERDGGSDLVRRMDVKCGDCSTHFVYCPIEMV
jgi:hypothetical protein